MMANRVVAMAMAQWKYRLRVSQLLRRHLLIMQKRTLSAAFAGWNQSAYVQKKLRHVRTFNMFLVWKRNAKRGIQQSLVVNKCILKMKKRNVARCFRSFEHNIEMNKAQRKAANFFRSGVRFRLFRLWRDYSRNEARIRLGGRVVMENRTKAAIARWRSWTGERIRTEDKLRRVTARIMHIELAKCMRTWVEMTSRSLRVKHLMRRQLEQSCYHWFHTWKESTE